MSSKRTVLITGGTRGIGKEILLQFAKEGYNVAFCYKNSCVEAENIMKALSQSGVNCLAVRCDVSKKDEVDKLYFDLKSHFGFVDTVVNNAGISHSGLFADESETDFDELISNNIKSVFLVSKAFLPDMLNYRFGRIINVSSIWGLDGASCEVLYSMTKAAVNGLTKALSKEVGLNGITVNAVAPGLIATDMTKDLSNEDINEFLKSVSADRIGCVSDIAPLVLFLASQAASYITGQIIRIDGGM